MKPVVYGLSNCTYCRATKKFLRKNGVEYEEIFVDMLEEDEKNKLVEHIKTLTGGTLFPVTECEKGFSVGFAKKELRELLDIPEED